MAKNNIIRSKRRNNLLPEEIEAGVYKVERYTYTGSSYVDYLCDTKGINHGGEDLPAQIVVGPNEHDGERIIKYFKHGKLHRIKGPAYIYIEKLSSRKQWYYNNNLIFFPYKEPPSMHELATWLALETDAQRQEFVDRNNKQKHER